MAVWDYYLHVCLWCGPQQNRVLVMLTWLSHHSNTKTHQDLSFFFTEKHEENLQKTQLGVVALLWIWHIFADTHYWAFEPSSVRDTKTSVLNIHGYCEVHNALQKMKSTVQRELIMLPSPASSSIIIFTHTQVLATTLRHRSTSVPLLTLTSLLFFSLILGLRAV